MDRTLNHNQPPKNKRLTLSLTDWEARKISASNGVVIDSCPNTEIKDYLLALKTYVPPECVFSISRISKGRISIYFNDISWTEKVIQKGLVINKTFLQARPVIVKTTKLVLSNVPPEVPCYEIYRLLSKFGKIVSKFRPIPASTNLPEFQHLISHRREVEIQLNDPTTIPESLELILDDIRYIFYISDCSLCHICRDTIHKREQCPKRRSKTQINQTNTSLSVINDQVNKILQPINSTFNRKDDNNNLQIALTSSSKIVTTNHSEEIQVSQYKEIEPIPKITSENNDLITEIIEIESTSTNVLNCPLPQNFSHQDSPTFLYHTSEITSPKY